MFSLTFKRKVKVWLCSRFVLVSVLVFVVLMVSPVWNMYKKYSESREMLLDSRERMGVLVTEKTQVEEDIDYLESDLGRESEIRRRFRTGREGERMVVIVEDERLDEETVEEETGGIWSGLKSFILAAFD